MVRRWPSASILLVRSGQTSASLLSFCDDTVDPGASPEFIVHRVDRTLRLAEFLGRSVEVNASNQNLFLLPRSRFIELAGWELARCRRYRGGFAVVRAALDHFGKTRDLRGHEAAERLKASFARMLLEVVRTSDLVAPWEDDGFAILLPEAGREQAAGFMRKVALRIEALAEDAEWKGESVSFGICCAGQKRESSADEWVDWAGQALRSAQREERGGKRELVFRRGEEQVVALSVGSAVDAD